MAISQNSKPCFQCKQEIRFEKVGEKEDGKPIWKKYELDGVHEHECKKLTGNSGSNKRQTELLLEELNRTVKELLAEVKRQGMR